MPLIYIPFALDLEHIAQGQNNNPGVWQQLMIHPLQYPEQQFGNTCAICNFPRRKGGTES
jgi:hypothetical protein